MKVRGFALLMAFAILGLFSVHAPAGQVRLTGEISGLVTDGRGEVLPGVSIVLTGEHLLQKSMTATTNERGFFRFLNLSPGDYQLEFTLQGFNGLKMAPVGVSVGVTTPVRARMTEATVSQEVVVSAAAPLVETKTVQLSTNYSEFQISKIPTSRNVQDLMEATPAINDHGAYGAGARVRTDYFEGSEANAYLLNGVDISDQGTGATWVNPNYDTIEEIQVIGIGAGAEYGNYSGAVLNVITKEGGNAFHGGLSSYFTSKGLYGDNSGGIVDLTPEEIKVDSETTGFLGGPVVREKLFFFLAGGFTRLRNRHYLEPAFGSLKQPHFQAKLNWLASSRNVFTAMVNLDPLDHDNLGLQPGSGPELAYSRRFRSLVWNASWRSVLGANTLFEAKYAGFSGRDATDPVSPTTAAISDYSTYRFYGSSGVIQNNRRTRHQVNGVLTQYLENFLSVSHEVKAGFEYESSTSKNLAAATGPNASMFVIYPYLDLFWILGYENYRIDTNANVNRFSAFLQDDIQIGRRATLNLGVRLDAPRLTSPGMAGTIAKYTNIAPRLGFSYDLSGDAKTVIHLGYGRYYDKMVTDGFLSALPGMGEVTIYSLFTATPFEPTPENIAALPGLVLVPENLYWTMPAASTIGVSEDLKGPYTDVFNVRLEREIFRNVALSVEYVHKNDRQFIRVNTSTTHTYQEVTWTDPYLGDTLSVWGQTDAEPDVWSYTNSTWGKRRHNFVIVNLRKRQSHNWSLSSSFVFQDSQGNDDNTTGPVGYNWGQDTNPNYTENPLAWGKLTFDRTYQFKLLGTYLLPWGFNVSSDLHILSGLAWQPVVSFQLTGLNGGQLNSILIEKRGSRRMPWTWFLNFRLGKEFRLWKSSTLELIADVFNVFNRANAASIAPEPYAVFPISGEDAFGKVFKLSPPFHARFGVRWTF